MEINEIECLVEQLFSKNNNEVYSALKDLKSESEKTNKVYKHFDTFAKMLSDENSYIRTRGLLLLACNVKWDKSNKFNKIVEQFLDHIEDEKPITSRQCIQSLKDIIQYKQELLHIIKDRLCKINYQKLPDTMSGLIFRDASKILELIDKKG